MRIEVPEDKPVACRTCGPLTHVEGVDKDGHVPIDTYCECGQRAYIVRDGKVKGAWYAQRKLVGLKPRVGFYKNGEWEGSNR